MRRVLESEVGGDGVDRIVAVDQGPGDPADPLLGEPTPRRDPERGPEATREVVGTQADDPGQVDDLGPVGEVLAGPADQSGALSARQAGTTGRSPRRGEEAGQQQTEGVADDRRGPTTFRREFGAESLEGPPGIEGRTGIEQARRGRQETAGTAAREPDLEEAAPRFERDRAVAAGGDQEPVAGSDLDPRRGEPYPSPQEEVGDVPGPLTVPVRVTPS